MAKDELTPGAWEKEKERLEQIIHQHQQERALFSTGPVLTFTWKPSSTGNVLQVSRNVTEILGYTPEEMTNPAFAYDDIVHPEDLERARSESVDYRKNGIHRYSQSYRLKTKSGDYRWFYDQTQCITDESGKIFEHRGYLVDQTTLKEAEEHLNKERQRLADIIEATHVGTWERNVQTNELWVNERWAEIMGFSLAELEPMTLATWVDLLHPKDLEAAKKEAFSVYHRKKQYYSVECRMKHKNSHWVWVHARGKVISWTEEGKPLMMSGTIADITERKQAEEILRDNEEQFRAMFESHDAIMLLIDPENGKIIRANQGAERFYGYTAAEIQSMRIQQINQLDNDAIASEMAHAKTQKRNYFNFLHRLATGEIRNVEVHSSPIPFNGKTILFSIIHDVTDRKLAEEALRESFMRYEELVSNVPVGVYVFWIRGNGHSEFEYVSDRWCEIHQLKREDVLADVMKANNLVHPDEQDDFLLRNQASFRHQIPFIWEGRFFTGEGSLRWLHIESTPVVFDNGDIRWFGVTADITDRKLAEEALLASKEKLETLSNNIPNGMVYQMVVDPQGNRSFTYVSAGVKRLQGFTPAEVLNNSHILYDQFLEDDRQKLIEAEEQAFSTLEPFSCEARIRKPGGEIRWVQFQSALSKNPDGSIVADGIAIDITEHKIAEEKLQDYTNLLEEKNLALDVAAQEAERANEAKNRYLSHMNHEMRTPLNGFMGFLELMEETRLDEQQQEFMHLMKQSSSHLLNIVSNVLDHAKIEAGQMRLDNRIFNLVEEIGTALAPLRSLARQKSVHLEIEMDKNLPRQVKGDPDRLRQIILNLGGNGVKFTEKGQVRIAIRCPESTIEEHLLKLVVEDSGSGMTEEVLKNLFQPFYQGDDGSSPQSKGTGLGLSITRELVELMGGEIQVDSTLNVGTRVEVSLKLKSAGF